MRFADLTWPGLKAVPRLSTVVVVPIAACEQHGHHLPVLTDSLIVTEIATRAEERLPGDVLLLPTLWLGASHHHLRFGGTLSLPTDLYPEVLRRLLEPILEEGFRRILVLNGHGGNVAPMQVALRTLQDERHDRILSGASYWELAADELAEHAQGPRRGMGHACEFETSMMMAIRPDLVLPDRIRDDDSRYADPALRGLYIAEDMKQCTRQGVSGFPEHASSEKGRRMLEAAISRVVETVHALLRKPCPS